MVFFSPVPRPNVIINKSRVGTVYAGTELTLTAEISFNDLSGVDVDTSWDIKWATQKYYITNGTRTKFFAIKHNRESYTASLTYTPINTSDTAWHWVIFSINPSHESTYINSARAIGSVNLTVQG